MKYSHFLYLAAFILTSCNTLSEKAKPINLEFIDYNLGLSNSFRGISVVDENIIWVSGTKGTVVHVDNEWNWIVNQVPEASEMDFRDVVAFDKNTALVVNAGFPGVIYKNR